VCPARAPPCAAGRRSGVSQIPELYTIGVERIKKYTFYKNPKTPVLQNKLGDSAGVFGAAWIGV
jgi:fructokinase